MSIIVVWDLGLEFPEHLSFFFFSNVRHWGLVLFSSRYVRGVSLWCTLGLRCSFGCFLGLGCSSPCPYGITHKLLCLGCWCSNLFFLFFIRVSPQGGFAKNSGSGSSDSLLFLLVL